MRSVLGGFCTSLGAWSVFIMCDSTGHNGTRIPTKLGAKLGASWSLGTQRFSKVVLHHGRTSRDGNTAQEEKGFMHLHRPLRGILECKSIPCLLANEEEPNLQCPQCLVWVSQTCNKLRHAGAWPQCSPNIVEKPAMVSSTMPFQGREVGRGGTGR